MLRVLSPDFCLYLVSFVQKEMPTLRNGVFTYTKWAEFLSCKCSVGLHLLVTERLSTASAWLWAEKM